VGNYFLENGINIWAKFDNPLGRISKFVNFSLTSNVEFYKITF